MNEGHFEETCLDALEAMAGAMFGARAPLLPLIFRKLRIPKADVEDAIAGAAT